MTKIRSSNDSMIDDRRSAGGGGRSGGFGFPTGRGGGGGFPPMRAGGGILGLLLLIAIVVLPRVLGGNDSGDDLVSTGSQSADQADGTCSSDLEQVLCGATIDVQEYWRRELPVAFGTQYQDTKTTFFSGATTTACGEASSDTGPFYCPLDGRVYLDLDFLVALEDQLVGRSSDLAEQYIVAHEYGHHVQNLLGTNDQVRQAQQNDPTRANQYSVALELQADCFAGAWVGDAASAGQLDSASEIQEALDAAAGVGDDRIQQQSQGRVDPDSWTHGSAEQRQTWFMRGYDSLDPATCTTFDEVL
ncbi:MAG: neutral zinc metallopeptidase [Ilumatobacteraceae bacterium]